MEIATVAQKGLSTYAASKWVEHLDSVFSKSFGIDKNNLTHTLLYAVLITAIVILTTRAIHALTSVT